MRTFSLAIVLLSALAPAVVPAMHDCNPEVETCGPPTVALALTKSVWSPDCFDTTVSVVPDFEETYFGGHHLDALSVTLSNETGTVMVRHDDVTPLSGFEYTFSLYSSLGRGVAWPFGHYTVNFTVDNGFGVASAEATFLWDRYVDTTAPTASSTVFAKDGSSPVNGWYTSVTRVDVLVEEECRLVFSGSVDGVTKTPLSYYRDGEHRFYDLSQDGLHTVEFTVSDLAGHDVGPFQVAVPVDRTPPEVAVARPKAGDLVVNDHVVSTGFDQTAIVVGRILLSADAFDATSGIADVSWSVDGTRIGHGMTISYEFEPGEHVLTARATDVAGHATLSAPVRVLALPSPASL